MPVKVNLIVCYKPYDLNYEVNVKNNGKELRFRTSKRKLELFIRDLTKKDVCKLTGKKGEKAIIQGSKNAPQRKQIIEYLELVLEGS